MKRAMVLLLAGISLSACAGFDVNMRGWQVRGFVAAPLQVPLVEQNVDQPRPVRVVHEVHTIARRLPCRPPRHLMDQDPYYGDDYVRHYRQLQRFIRRECQ